MNLQKEFEYAWCAGFFEGEGSITVDSRWKSVRLCVGQCDPAVLVRFAEAFDMPEKVQGPHIKRGVLEVWRVDFSGKDAAYAIECMRPYLSNGCEKLNKFDTFWYENSGRDHAYITKAEARRQNGGERTS